MRLLNALIIAVSAGLCSAAKAASWSPDGEWLAYSYIGGPENLYLVRTDGSGARDLLVRKSRDFRPEWAPDGSHLVFTAAADGKHVVMRIDPDGSGLEAVTKPGVDAADPDYAAGGWRLVYHNDARDLYLLDVANGEITHLTKTPDFEETSPRFAPDGELLVFVGKVPGGYTKGDIWTVDIATGKRRNLTDTPAVDEFHPDVSHDGRYVVYVRNAGGEFSLGVHDLFTGAERVVADGNGYAVLDPHFSTDDASLTFTRTDFAEKGPGMPAIVQLSLDDGSEAVIVKGLYIGQNPR
jgi:Tol biopolymer transport system component